MDNYVDCMKKSFGLKQEHTVTIVWDMSSAFMGNVAIVPLSSKQYYITHPIIIRFFLSSNAVAITQVTISNNLIHFIDFCVFQTSYGSYFIFCNALPEKL